MAIEVVDTYYTEEILTKAEVKELRKEVQPLLQEEADLQAPWYVQLASIFCNTLSTILTELGIIQLISENYLATTGGTAEEQFWGYLEIEDTMEEIGADLVKVRHRNEYIKIYIEGEVAYEGWSVVNTPDAQAYHVNGGWRL
ncbi:hypothetical protein [Caldisalinibacter kiritimatiensis]|uniref:Uncharacterized protein n=1 Tax=Caldisalinibacter kiritimatiensis TaxID=1304284 RepID=R1CMU0_9FIRM|nr:hypothetical protein [Caldisalinibacter kiritimatiensis]EOC99995.1 hypothetical protein L21TH_1963 [Caldisalinibacter kiritimatiensis]